jgi:hypothetical protein
VPRTASVPSCNTHAFADGGANIHTHDAPNCDADPYSRSNIISYNTTDHTAVGPAFSV